MLIADADEAAIRTGTNGAIDPRLADKPASLRQRNSRLLAIPNFRATAETAMCCVSSTACRRSSSDQHRLVSITTILSLEICPDIGTEPISGRYNHRLNTDCSISSECTKQGGHDRTHTLWTSSLTNHNRVPRQQRLPQARSEIVQTGHIGNGLYPIGPSGQSRFLKLPWTIRSITMAQSRIARPANNPCPLAAYCSDSSTTDPSP